jgi:hypothetical protein
MVVAKALAGNSGRASMGLKEALYRVKVNRKAAAIETRP